MDRITSQDTASVSSEGISSAPPRRRWSDGPNYPWSPATDDTWSVATHWPALVAALCEEVADGTTGLAREIDRLCKHGLLSQVQAAQMRETIQGMRASGMALQQIVRLGAGLHNLSPDRIDLSLLARAAVKERQRDVLKRGIEISHDLRRAEVWVDGATAAGLMQAGLEWALGFSRKVRIKVEPGTPDEPACIVIRGALPSPVRTRSARAQMDRRMNDNLHWVLMRQLAASARLPIGRSSSAATESAVIEFPATITVGPRRLA